MSDGIQPATDGTGEPESDPTNSAVASSGPSAPAGPGPSVVAAPGPSVAAGASGTVPDTIARAGLGDHLGALAGLEQRPLAGHPEVFEQIHTALQASLAEIDNA